MQYYFCLIRDETSLNIITDKSSRPYLRGTKFVTWAAQKINNLKH